MIKKTIILTILCALTSVANASTEAVRISYRQQCLEIKKYLIKDSYRLDCNYSYHHYNADSSKKYYAGNSDGVKIASFNLFNPGNSQTFFKDYNLIAKIINSFDIVAGLELLPIIGEDLDNNESVLKLLGDSSKLSDEVKDYNLAVAPSLYRAPGYLKILNELRQLDPSWSLLITPRGQGSELSNVQELAGFYYRASRARTIQNDYCKEFVTNHVGSPVGCIPNFGSQFLGKDLKQVFSRRPFIASFQSGNFQFTLLTSHVIFTSPIDLESMAKILLPTFDVSDYHELGTGVTKQNYARFAEIQATLYFMDKIHERYPTNKLILMGDLNIEASNSFWDQLLSRSSGHKLFITEPTTTTVQRYNRNGEPTNGYASNYDHFIYNPKQTTNCDSASRFDFYNQDITEEINKRYLVRSPDKTGDIYPIMASDKIAAGLELLQQKLYSRYTIKYNHVVWDDYKFEYRLSSFKKRVFSDQQYDKTYYRLFTEVISDHAPISLNCRTE